MERFLQNLISYGFSYLIAGRKNYGFWKSKNYSFRSAKIKNQKLAQELEDACQKNKGFLTYCEFLDIDQFGKNGYHAKNVMHGITNTHKNWSKTLAFLCKEKGLDQIVELGPGDGKLAIKILKEAKKMGSEVFWSGVEVNEKLREEIKKRFKKEGLDNNLKIITDSLKNIPSNLKALVTFSYSLDSISPEIFINTSETKSFPNALIGITVNNGLIKEIIIKNDSLKKKGIFLKEGIYKDKNGNSFDLRSWKLYKGQRAYIPINSFSAFIDFVNHFSCDSSFVIMDEFRASVFDWETEHLCMPKKLNTFKKKREIEIEKQYEEAGKNLLYYPVYFHTFLKFLNSLGFTSIKYDIEQKLAKELIQEKWISLKRYYFTNAFICSRREKRSLETFKIEFPQQKLV